MEATSTGYKLNLEKVAQVHDDLTGMSEASDSALEERLRQALSRAAPQGLPTIGVRERIVGSVRARVRRRQQLAGSLAACCLLIAGVSAGVVSWHATQHPGSSSAAVAPLGANKKSVSGAARTPSPDLARPSRAARAGCGEISEGNGVVSGCYGVYDRSPDFSVNGPVYGFPIQGDSTASTVPGSYSASGPAPGSTGAKSATGGSAAQGKEVIQGEYKVVVPVGRPVTVILPGTAGEIWSAPAVAPGQGSGATQVRIVEEGSGGVGDGSSASFESGIPVTVLIDASALPVCGSLHIPCGAPTSTWSLVLEFQKS
jgi:hypothetical protein